MSEREKVLQEFGNEVVVHDLDGEPSGYAWRVNADAMADEIVRLRALTPAPRVVVTDTQRLDALERGDIEIECMGTTVRYFNVLSRSGRMVTASPVDANPLTLREAIDAALTEVRDGA